MQISYFRLIRHVFKINKKKKQLLKDYFHFGDLDGKETSVLHLKSAYSFPYLHFTTRIRSFREGNAFSLVWLFTGQFPCDKWHGRLFTSPARPVYWKAGGWPLNERPSCCLRVATIDISKQMLFVLVTEMEPIETVIRTDRKRAPNRKCAIASNLSTMLN